MDCASTASPFPSISKREFDAATRVPNEKPRTLNSMTALQIRGASRRSGYLLKSQPRVSKMPVHCPAEPLRRFGADEQQVGLALKSDVMTAYDRLEEVRR